MEILVITLCLSTLSSILLAAYAISRLHKSSDVAKMAVESLKLVKARSLEEQASVNLQEKLVNARIKSAKKLIGKPQVEGEGQVIERLMRGEGVKDRDGNELELV
jgi:hypothetical protein